MRNLVGNRRDSKKCRKKITLITSLDDAILDLINVEDIEEDVDASTHFETRVSKDIAKIRDMTLKKPQVNRHCQFLAVE